jgi:hypothetical protein
MGCDAEEVLAKLRVRIEESHASGISSETVTSILAKAKRLAGSGKEPPG